MPLTVMLDSNLFSGSESQEQGDCVFKKCFFNFFIDFRGKEVREGEGERERWGREREINLLFHLFMHSLVDSCISPDQGSNP